MQIFDLTAKALANIYVYMKITPCRLNGSIYLDINGTLIPFGFGELTEFRAVPNPARVRWLREKMPVGSSYRKALEEALTSSASD